MIAQRARFSRRDLSLLTALPLLFGLISGVVGCQRAPAAKAPPGAPAQNAPEPPTSSSEEPANPPVALTPELEELVALRQLHPTAPIVSRKISRDALKDHLSQMFASQVPPATLTGTQDALIALGLAPPNFDYRKAMLTLMQSEIAGFYDPKADALFVIDGLPDELVHPTLLHELVHALQDQNYTLDAVDENAPDGTDRRSALSTLAEGDATSTMFDAMLKSEGRTALDIPTGILERQLLLSTEAVQVEDVPRVLVSAMVAPYVDGLRFVHALRARGGFTEVDRVWKSPPSTTEQALHLDRYDAGEPARLVDLVRLPAPYEVHYQDVWGEQSLRVLFEQWAEPAPAAKAAEGWGGDRIAVFRGKGATVVSYAIDFDTEPDALEAWILLLEGPLRTEGAPLPGATKQRCRERPDGGPFAAKRDGAKLRILLGPFDDTSKRGVGSCHETSAWLTRL